MNVHLQTLISRYHAGGNLLKYAVGGLSPEHAAATPGPGAWSIAGVTAHLLDCDLVAADRMKRVIAEEEPALLAFDESAWFERLRSESMPIDEAVSLFEGNRHWMSRVLRNCPETDFARAGQHSEKGRITLAEILTTFVNHLDHHLKFIYAKRANLGIAIQPRYSYDSN